MGSKLHDLTGMRFGHWYVRERDTTEHFHPTRWICVCDCGTVQSISLPALRHGSSSCRKCADGVVRNPNFLRKHSNRLYHTWSEMRRRCAGKCTNSEYYKEKGIGYAEEWDDFDAFARWALENGYEKGLEIDRIDGDKAYSPSNCRWVSHKVNSRNRKARKNNTTGVAGVAIRKRKDGSIVYRASISSDNGKVLLGTFYSLEDAAKARKEAELKYWGFNIGE